MVSDPLFHCSPKAQKAYERKWNRYALNPPPLNDNQRLVLNMLMCAPCISSQFTEPSQYKVSGICVFVLVRRGLAEYKGTVSHGMLRDMVFITNAGLMECA